MEEVIDGILDELQMSTDTAAFTQALQLLHRIVGNVVQHPTDPKYRTLKLSNAKFMSQVWSHTAAQQFMLMIGWEEAGDAVTLPMGMELSHVLKVLDARVKTVLGDSAVAAAAAAPAAAPTAPAAAAPASAKTPSSSASAASAAAAAAGGSCGGGGGSCASGEAGQKRSGQDEALEKMRQDKLARERIKQQIAADRQNTAAREERASVARQLQPGSRITRFSDVGIDLNKKSG